MKTRSMKSTHQFRDQVNAVTAWFKTWNECEQTVALYSLLKKVSVTQAKFLLQVLLQSVQDCADVQSIEREANNPDFVSGLCNESKENAVNHLLSHLPLLRPGNLEAKAQYLNIIPKVLAHSIENGIHIEESRQLLSYSLIHPAITGEERSQFTLWLSHLEDRCSYSIYQHQMRLQQQQQVNSDLPTKTPLQDLTHTNISPPYPGLGDNKELYGQCLSAAQQQAVLSRNVGTNSWNQSGSRDSGIVTDSLAVAHPSVAHGRAITASNGTAALGPPGANLNGAHEHIPLHMTHSGPAAFNSSTPPIPPVSQPNHVAPNLHRKLTRSASVTPPMSVPTSAVSDWLNSQDDLVLRNTHSHPLQHHHHGNHHGMIEGHAPLSPQSSVTSSGSGSDTHEPDQHQRNTFLEDCSGMKDVPVWLKSLRLHKYAYLFQQLTYEDMLTLTEDWLEQQNVTKGARHKIILSVQKLKERQNTLKLMEKEVMEQCNIKLALSELRQMLNMPLKWYTPSAQRKPSGGSTGDENTDPQGGGDKENEGKENSGPVTPTDGDSIHYEDLPGQICRVLGKICTQLLVSARPEDECFGLYVQLLDKCMMHEAFTQKQKKLMMSWKQQVHKIWHPPPQKYPLEKRRSFGNTYPISSLGNIARQRPVRGVPGPGQPHWTFSKRPPLAPTGTAAAQLPLYRNNSLNTAIAARPQVFELKQAVQRTHSAPIKSSQFGLGLSSRPVSDMGVTEPEINARLDSLCLSMTEHALGGFSDWSTASYSDPTDRGSTF